MTLNLPHAELLMAEPPGELVPSLYIKHKQGPDFDDLKIFKK
jgi:hypothetical protein